MNNKVCIISVTLRPSETSPIYRRYLFLFSFKSSEVEISTEDIPFFGLTCNCGGEEVFQPVLIMLGSFIFN